MYITRLYLENSFKITEVHITDIPKLNVNSKNYIMKELTPTFAEGKCVYIHLKGLKYTLAKANVFTFT